MDKETYQRYGLNNPFAEDSYVGEVINGRSNQEIFDALSTPGDSQYNPCPEAYPDEKVPRGSVTNLTHWSESSIYPNTQRDIWIYVPSKFDAHGEPPAVMVFNDGGWYLDEIGRKLGPIRAAKVFDSLIYSGEMPPTISVFIMPGRPDNVSAGTKGSDPRTFKQRSIEHDSCTDTYVRFLLADVLPVAANHIGFGLTEDSARRTICGFSSG